MLIVPAWRRQVEPRSDAARDRSSRSRASRAERARRAVDVEPRAHRAVDDENRRGPRRSCPRRREAEGVVQSASTPATHGKVLRATAPITAFTAIRLRSPALGRRHQRDQLGAPPPRRGDGRLDALAVGGTTGRPSVTPRAKKLLDRILGARRADPAHRLEPSRSGRRQVRGQAGNAWRRRNLVTHQTHSLIAGAAGGAGFGNRWFTCRTSRKMADDTMRKLINVLKNSRS